MVTQFMCVDPIDLDDEQSDRARRLVAATDFTIDEARRIINFADTDRDDRSRCMLLPGDGDGDGRADRNVDEQTCARIRRAMVSASDVREVMPSFPGLTTSQLFAHAKGRCDHDIDTPTTLSPRISQTECREMRDAFVGGSSVNDIKSEFFRSTNAVISHVFGECDHGHGPRGSHLSEAEIDRLHHVYVSNPSRTMSEVAAAFRVSPSTVHRYVGDARRDERH